MEEKVLGVVLRGIRGSHSARVVGIAPKAMLKFGEWR
uniref:Uncharacterized protein n=1 Tax=Anguilla anguilla TaxID=7936 RepID=A0A0E9Q9J4_ANGAN